MTEVTTAHDDDDDDDDDDVPTSLFCALALPCTPMQVSRVVHDELVEMTGVPLERIAIIYDTYGNMGPASFAIALSLAEKQGRLRPGMRVAVMVLASGMNCCMGEIIW